MSDKDFPPEDARIDEALAESFPASDPPSYNAGIPKEENIMKQREESSSSFAWLIGGFALGAACGLLLAPKKGSELIEDIEDWGREQGERGRDLYAKAKEYIPHRTRRAVSEAVGEARRAGERAYRGVRDKAEDFEV
ncbi:MAG: YtxH domain-containing protein [Elusimicrobiota bacterium]|nr:MAG: YtxH domain-containing protein [Elusimicrobiota bacterium]